jgi:hypothetical protein
MVHQPVRAPATVGHQRWHATATASSGPPLLPLGHRDGASRSNYDVARLHPAPGAVPASTAPDVPVNHSNARAAAGSAAGPSVASQYCPHEWIATSLAVAHAPKPGAATDGTKLPLRLWAAYCTAVHRHPALPHYLDDMEVDPLAPGRLHDFYGWCRHTRPNCQPRTLDAYVGTVRSQLAIDGIHLKRTPLLTRTVLRLQQRVPVHEVRRQPATPQLIGRVFHDTSIHLGVRTAILFAFEHLLRVSEYTASSALYFQLNATLLRQHVQWRGDLGGYQVFLPYNKTNVYNTGSYVFLFPRPDDSCCPVKAMSAYLAATADNPPHLPLFMYATVSNPFRFVTREDISVALRRHAAGAGLPVHQISSHSIRIGAACALLDAGVEWSVVKVRGRWRSDSVLLAYGRMSTVRCLIASAALRIDGSEAGFPLLPAPSVRTV